MGRKRHDAVALLPTPIAIGATVIRCNAAGASETDYRLA